MNAEKEKEISERIFTFMRTGQSIADLVENSPYTERECLEVLNRIEKKYKS